MILPSLCSIRMYVAPSFEAEWLLQLIFTYWGSWWIGYVFAKKKLRIPPKILIIQPFNLTFSIPDCGLLCLLSCDQSWTLFCIYSGYVSESCFSRCQSWYTLHWLALNFRMYVELAIPEYLLIWILWLLSQWVCTMLCLHGGGSDIFQQRVSCIINHDLCVVTYCLFTSCSSLDKPQHATDFSQLCFEYGVSSLNHTYLHAECHCQLWIIVYLFNVGSVFDVPATVLTQLQHVTWPCKQDHVSLLTMLAMTIGQQFVIHLTITSLVGSLTCPVDSCQLHNHWLFSEWNKSIDMLTKSSEGRKPRARWRRQRSDNFSPTYI